MIFKLQRQMFPDDAPIRAYDKYRHHEIELPPSETLLGWFGTRLKIYVDAVVVNETGLDIRKMLHKPPPW
jgi:hypothetical protein